jgi:hypothetical protein
MVGKISDHDLPNRAGYYVMTNADDKFSLGKKKLWVIDDKLYCVNNSVYQLSKCR